MRFTGSSVFAVADNLLQCVDTDSDDIEDALVDVELPEFVPVINFQLCSACYNEIIDITGNEEDLLAFECAGVCGSFADCNNRLDHRRKLSCLVSLNLLSAVAVKITESQEDETDPLEYDENDFEYVLNDNSGDTLRSPEEQDEPCFSLIAYAVTVGVLMALLVVLLLRHRQRNQ